MPTRKAHAEWNGAIDSGDGRMEFGSGAFEGPYSFKSRMQDGTGTNPEELIGAAHAGCFSMALSLILGDGGHPPDSISTDAAVKLRAAGRGLGDHRHRADDRRQGARASTRTGSVRRPRRRRRTARCRSR